MTGYTTLDPCRKAYCRPVINTPPPCKGLDTRIPSVVPVKGRGLLTTGLHYPPYTML